MPLGALVPPSLPHFGLFLGEKTPQEEPEEVSVVVLLAVGTRLELKVPTPLGERSHGMC